MDQSNSQRIPVSVKKICPKFCPKILFLGMEDAKISSLFENAMNASDSKIDMSQDESEKFQKAMKDPTFCALLQDYMSEISDPAHRAESEMYLQQLEKDSQVPSDKALLTPEAGFVLKCKKNEIKKKDDIEIKKKEDDKIKDKEDKIKEKKVFINVCHTIKYIDPPTSTAAVPSEQKGSHWDLPYSLGPLRLEMDKGKLGIIF